MANQLPPLAHALQLLASLLKQREQTAFSYRDEYQQLRGGLRTLGPRFETGEKISARELANLAGSAVLLLSHQIEIERLGQEPPTVAPPARAGTARAAPSKPQRGCSCIYADGQRLPGEHPCARHPGGT